MSTPGSNSDSSGVPVEESETKVDDVVETVQLVRQDMEGFEPSSLSIQPPFYARKHINYIIKSVAELSKETSYEGAITEHLRMSGIYWSLTALHILLPSTRVNEIMNVNDYIMDWIWKCYHGDGCFGGNTGQDGHILYTLSALQIMAISDQLHTDERILLCKSEIIEYICNLQQPDGSFVGDNSACGEVDTRFTYCALQSLALLNALDKINIDAAVNYIMKCQNMDGGFGSCIGAESHAGQVFCCIGALSIAQKIHLLDENDTDSILGWWLSERQVDSGGLNGRPEKQADVCYSWWILSSLSILGKVSWINIDKLAQYILKCQDDIDGGIADRPDDMTDIFHTFFGIAGLSLLGHLHQQQEQEQTEEENTVTTTSFRPIDPIYALPTDVVRKLNLPGQVMTSHNVKEIGTVEERLQHYNIFSK